MKYESMFSPCRICPRECGADRLRGELGYCRMPAALYCARAALHPWEEPCISVGEGSGTIFFSGCNLRCSYCQNRAISRGEAGIEITVERLVEIFLELQQKGAANINLVTATHYLPYLLEAIPLAKEAGLSVPIVYNCGGYEKVETLAMLEGLIDIYLPDFKYVSEAHATTLSEAPDYPRIAALALREMVRQVGAPRFEENGKMTRGVIVRHLVLPGCAEDAILLSRDLFAGYGNRICFSVMNQYTPPTDVAMAPPLNRPLGDEEYARVLEEIERLGMFFVFVQEGGTVSESFIPAFDGEGVFR